MIVSGPVGNPEPLRVHRKSLWAVPVDFKPGFKILLISIILFSLYVEMKIL